MDTNGDKRAFLGLGCAGLTAVGSRKDALRLLEFAYDCGIRHYDVARLYGMGLAEGIVGEFIRARRAQLTVTTKFGLEPPKYAGKLATVVSGAKRVLKWIPSLDRWARRRIARGAAPGRFSAADARRSLEISLKELQTDYIDIWLLHEAGLRDAEDPELLEFLAAQQRAGTIRKAGLGSEFALLQGDCSLFPPQYSVFQFENGILRNNRQRLRNSEARVLITHSAFKDAARVEEILRAREDAARRFRSDTGLDPLEANTRNALMLAWAVHDNPGSLVLFGSTQREHVRANVASLEDPRYSRQATALFSDLLGSASAEHRQQAGPA